MQTKRIKKTLLLSSSILAFFSLSTGLTLEANAEALEEIHNEEVLLLDTTDELELSDVEKEELQDDLLSEESLNKTSENFELIDELANFGDPLRHLYGEEVVAPVTTFSAFSTSSTSSTTTVNRIAGNNRLRVAENISRGGWSSSNTVVIANGYQFTDALSGTPLAAHYNAPMLLVDNKGISNETLAEIARLQANKAIILGGHMSVPKKVEETLKSRGIEVQRIAGENRYDTSRKIAEELITLRGPSSAHLVNGDAFADAVSISAVAGRYKHPILLTRADTLHPEVQAVTNRIKDWRIIGGNNSISTTVEKQLTNRVTNVSRISGKNRYEVNKRVLNHWSINKEQLYVGSGEAFSDVLAGSVLAARQGTGVLLTSNNTVDIHNAEYYARDTGIEKFVLLGGESTLSSKVFNTFEQLYRTIERVHSNGIYTVQAGDNFRRIAEGFGMTTLQLSQWNPQVSDINRISIGDKIAVTKQGVESMLSSAQKNTLIGTNNPSQFNNTQQFVDWMAPRAQKVASQKGEEALYPSLMIAQAMHESGVARQIGESQLARAPHYNLFGIKARNNQAFTLAWTWEHVSGQDIDVLAKFRSFSSYDESLQEYAKLLRYGRGTGEDFYYRGTWRKNTKDIFEVLDEGGLRGYATDPAYFNAVRKYIKDYNLTQYD